MFTSLDCSDCRFKWMPLDIYLVPGIRKAESLRVMKNFLAFPAVESFQESTEGVLAVDATKITCILFLEPTSAGTFLFLGALSAFFVSSVLCIVADISFHRLSQSCGVRKVSQRCGRDMHLMRKDVIRTAFEDRYTGATGKRIGFTVQHV